jgi:hypothetical protein
LFVSDEFYTKVVELQIPILKTNFVKERVQTKDGQLTAWRLTYQKPPDKRKRFNQVRGKPRRKAKTAPRGKKKSYILATLPTVSILISAADVHNFNLYKRTAGSVPLVNHIETALLLGQRAFMHCTDPYRSNVVFELLNEFEGFIRDGTLLFLLGSSIQNPRKDFVPYISSKASQYRESGHGAADIVSLNTSASTLDIDAVLDLLDMSPVLLHRGYGGTEMFLKAVKADFSETEVLGTSHSPLLGKLRHINLTLRQILSIQQLTDGNRPVALVADREQTDSIVNDLIRKIDHDSFSRQILLSLIRETLTNKVDEAYFDLLETRINLIHLRINVGQHNFIEFHPERERTSPYYHCYLLDHLAALVDRAPKERCGVSLVKALRSQPTWDLFAAHHLRIMAYLQARRLGDLDCDPNGYFLGSGKRFEFKAIANVINEHWN